MTLNGPLTSSSAEDDAAPPEDLTSSTGRLPEPCCERVEPAPPEEPSFGFAITDAAKGERVRVYVATREEIERKAAPQR